MNKILNSKILGAHSNHILILHGIFGMNDNWNSIGKELSKNFTIHLLDVRNHGLSFHSNLMTYELMAEDVINYLSYHNIVKSSIIGHSMGGKIAMQALLNFSEYFERCVIVDIAPKKYPPQHNEVIRALMALDLSLISKREDINNQLENFIKEEGIRLWLMKSIYLSEGVYKFKFNLEVILKNYDLLAENIIFTQNNSTTIPTLFLKGDNSEYIILDDSETINKIFKNNKVIEIKNAGHWTHVDNPLEVINRIIEFMK